MKPAISKFGVVTVFFVLLSSAVAQDDPPPPWAKFEPEGAGFSVLMPGKPVETIDKRATYTLHSFTVQMGRGTYVASFSDYAREIRLDPASALMSNRDKFNKNLKATLLTSREITLDGQPGLEFTSETPAANVKSQLFLVGNRMYQTVTFVFKDVDETRNVDRFFESFKLKPYVIMR
jgi:hypothetical protein